MGGFRFKVDSVATGSHTALMKIRLLGMPPGNYDVTGFSVVPSSRSICQVLELPTPKPETLRSSRAATSIYLGSFRSINVAVRTPYLATLTSAGRQAGIRQGCGYSEGHLVYCVK